MRIGGVEITNGGRPYFIADIAANHDGELNRALMLIELAKESGADAAKFQNFKAKTIVSRKGFATMTQLSHQAGWSKSVYDVYSDASVDDDWTPILKAKCDEVGIEYMTSPYDFPSVDLADRYSNAFKIGSGDITWLRIVEHIAAKGKPVLLATGASGMEDVKRVMTILERYGNPTVLMQCNTNYTASTENFKYINLNVINTYRQMFPDCVLGLSDHTFGHVTVLGAFALGARVFEKHFTDDNNRQGPDHRFAMNPSTWRDMVDATNILYQAMGDGIKRIEDNEHDATVVQRRALFLARDKKMGDFIEANDLVALRPIREGGIPPYMALEVIGKRMLVDAEMDTYLRMDMLEELEGGKSNADR
jgi:N-acetylneuraminate synthase